MIAAAVAAGICVALCLRAVLGLPAIADRDPGAQGVRAGPTGAGEVELATRRATLAAPASAAPAAPCGESEELFGGDSGLVAATLTAAVTDRGEIPRRAGSAGPALLSLAPKTSPPAASA